MDRARLVFEKWTRNAEAKIFEANVRNAVFRPVLPLIQPLPNVCLFQSLASRREALANLRLSRLGHLVNQARDRAGLDGRDWHKLPAASSAAFLARNTFALPLALALGRRDEVVGKDLQ